MASIRTGRTDVELHNDQGGEYIDVRVDGEATATVVVTEDTVEVGVTDPNNPEEEIERFRFDRPE